MKKRNIAFEQAEEKKIEKIFASEVNTMPR